MTWDSALDELEIALAEVYSRKEDSFRPVDKSGLDSTKVTFSDRAIDNWHNILLEAIKSGKVQALLEFTLKDSNSQRLEEAYKRHLSRARHERTTGRSSEESRSPHASKIAVGRLPSTGRHLFGRERELELLDQAWSDPATQIVSAIAWGGVGKSALINHWLRQMAHDQYRGAEQVYAWSFYRQGTSERAISADEFIASALTWFNDADPTKGTAWEKGERLASLVRSKRTLLILDGLEPLQFPPGPQEGALKDHALQALLRELAAFNNGLCVISTRLPIADIEDFEGSSARRINLDHLSSRAGAELLQAHGAKGSQADLERASNEFDGHCLALTLLGSYLKDVHEGDVRRRDKVLWLEPDTRQGSHAQRVMASYETWLGIDGPEVAVLRLLGFFDRPADQKALDALKNPPAIPGLTDSLQNLNQRSWTRVLLKLRRTKLLAERDSDEVDALDAHPLVREYFGCQVRERMSEAWREGNNRLYEHFKLKAKSLPETIQEMEPLLLAVVYGCNAGRHQDALHEVYLPRIVRGEQSYAARRWGAYGALLSALGYFFVDGCWSNPVSQKLTDHQGLNPDDQLTVLTQAGLYLTSTKGYASEEVKSCYGRVQELSMQLGKTSLLYSVLISQWRYSMVTSKLTTTLRLAKEIHTLAQSQNDPALFVGAYRALSIIEYFRGRFDLAQEDAREGIDLWTREKSIKAEEVYTPVITCMAVDAMVLWHFGYPDQARARIKEAISLARELSDISALATPGLFLCSYLNHFCRDEQETLKSAQELIEISSVQGFALWLAAGKVLKGWALSMRQEAQEGLALIREGLLDWRELGAGLSVSYFFSLEAEVLWSLGQTGEALAKIEEALSFVERFSEQWWLSELYRLKGEMLLKASDDVVNVKSCFDQALAIARSQGSRSLELRAAMSLYRLAHQQGNDHEARQVVAGIFNQFTEGFETADLQEARRLLES